MDITRTTLFCLLVAVLAACSDNNDSGDNPPWEVSTDSATLLLFSEGQLVSVDPQTRLAAVQKGLSLELYDLSSLDNPVLLSNIDSDAAILAASLADGRLFVITEDGYLSYYDVEAAHNPMLLSRIEVGVFMPHEFADAMIDQLPKMLTVDADRLFVSLHDKVILLTIDEPGQLHIAAEFPFDYASTSVSGNLLFVVSNAFQSHCFSLEGPGFPCDTYYFYKSSLHILDISVVDEPVEIQEAIAPDGLIVQQYSPPLITEDGFYLCEAHQLLPTYHGVKFYQRGESDTFELAQNVELDLPIGFGFTRDNTAFCQLSDGFVVYLQLSFDLNLQETIAVSAIDLSDSSSRIQTVNYFNPFDPETASDIGYVNLLAYEYPIAIFDTEAGSVAVDVAKLEELQNANDAL